MDVLRRDSNSSEVKSGNENTVDSQVPPPSYTSFIYKLENFTNQSNDNLSVQPPRYSELHNPSVIYINNYPGPPLDDGVVQIVSPNSVANQQDNAGGYMLTKRMKRYFNLNSLLMICFGLLTIGLQTGLVIRHALVYYYYGYWAGGVVICIGLSDALFYRQPRQMDIGKYFRSFLWQPIFLALVFSFGLIILLVEKCSDDSSKLNISIECSNSTKIINILLIISVALALLQSITTLTILGVLKRRHRRT